MPKYDWDEILTYVLVPVAIVLIAFIIWVTLKY